MANIVRFTKSQRGKSQAAFDGYLYTFDNFSKRDHTLKFWVCAKYSRGKDDSCPARLHTRGEQAVKVEQDRHNHDEDPALLEAKEIRNIIKQRAIETVELPGVIKDQVLHQQAVVPAVALKLGTDDSLRKMVEFARNQRDAAPPDPQNLHDLVIPEKYKLYNQATGEKFLLFDSGPDIPQRILIFGRESVGEWAGQVENLFVDGTFKICPNLWSQVMMVLGKRNGYVFPLFYCLLPSKTRQIYERLFQAISNLYPNLQPESAAGLEDSLPSNICGL
jgi:hypothetical protein